MKLDKCIMSKFLNSLQQSELEAQIRNFGLNDMPIPITTKVRLQCLQCCVDLSLTIIYLVPTYCEDLLVITDYLYMPHCGTGIPSGTHIYYPHKQVKMVLLCSLRDYGNVIHAQLEAKYLSFSFRNKLHEFPYMNQH